MAERRISALLPVTSPSTDDVLPVVNANVTKRVTINNLVKASDFSTFKINTLPTGTPISTNLFVYHDGSQPRHTSISNLYPVPVNSTTIGLTFNASNRQLQASVNLNSIDEQHIVDGAITQNKIDASVNIGGATGGGTDKAFWVNDKNISVNYTIPAGKNAMSAGPMTIQNSVVVTVPNGSTWTVV